MKNKNTLVYFEARDHFYCGSCQVKDFFTERCGGRAGCHGGFRGQRLYGRLWLQTHGGKLFSEAVEAVE